MRREGFDGFLVDFVVDVWSECDVVKIAFLWFTHFYISMYVKERRGPQPPFSEPERLNLHHLAQLMGVDRPGRSYIRVHCHSSPALLVTIYISPRHQ